MAQAAIIDKCELCETEENVNFFCVSCEEILCSNCKLLHSKNRKTKNDKVILLSQARDNDLVHKSTVVYCSKHSTVEVTLFCLKCDKLISNQCVAGKHGGHNITSPDEIRYSKTQELYQIIKLLQDKKSSCENAFDIRGQVYSKFLKYIDRVESEISEQKVKIIEELTILCDEQFSQLSKLRQDEEKKYSDDCNEIQAQNQAYTTAIQAAQNSIATKNSTDIIHAIVDATNTLHAQKELTTTKETITTFLSGDRSRPTIRHVQGKVNIKQKTIALPQSGDKNIPPTGQFQGGKPKPMPDAHKVKLQEQKTSGDNKQQKHEENKPRIDVKKVRVKSIVKVKDNSYIYVIVPLENKTAWVQCDGDKHLTLINSAGKIINKSVSLGSAICNAKQYKNRLLVTCRYQSKIYSLSLEGKSKSTFSDLSPYTTRGLCVTHDLDVMVCLYRFSKDNKIVRLNTAGNIMQTIQQDVTGAALYNDPFRVTSLPTGEVIVREGSERIVCVGREGQHLFTWKGEVQGEKLASYMCLLWDITHDSNSNLFVTDYYKNRVLVLGKGGSGTICLLDRTQGIDEPYGIAIHNTGQL